MKNLYPICGVGALLSILLSACGSTPTTPTNPSAEPAPTNPSAEPTAAAPPSFSGERCADDPLPPGVVAFAEGMTAPNPSTLPPPPLTALADAARASGRVVVSCIITTEGRARQCVLRETLPYMSKVVLAAIQGKHFEPAKINGKPQAVEYSFVWDYPANKEDQPVGPPGQMVGGPFSSNNFTPPTRVSGPDPRYSPEARCHRVEGMMVVQCNLTEQGVVRNCIVRQTVPYMEEAVVDALESSRYSPLLVNGVPTRVRYTFKLRVLPRK